MANERVERRLTAILAADVVGYSRLMGADEEGTLAALKAIRRELGDPAIAEHRGRVVKTTGDGLLVEFASVVDAVRCAVAFQQAMAERGAGVAPARRIEFRIGVNLGDVILDDGDIFGDGVNIAARLETLAEPGGICISVRVHEEVANKVDAFFEDIGQQALKNIARPVRVYRVGPRASRTLAPPEEAGGTPAVPTPALTLPDKPSIAVLPFQNMSGDSEQEYFADGMVEEIITALSRIRWLFVIARNSSFTYKGEAVDVKRVGRELGVRYVLEGSVRKGSNRVRITAQLIDAETGAHLWADRFDGALDDVFDLQDQVASNVAGAIQPTMLQAEVERSLRRSTASLSSYDFYLRALPHMASSGSEAITRAVDLLQQAIELDPSFARAFAAGAFCHVLRGTNGWADDVEVSRTNALSLARQALRTGADDPEVLATAAWVRAFYGEDIDASIGLIERGIALNPSFARGWQLSGWIRVSAGQPDVAVEHFEVSIRLDPRGRRFAALTGVGVAHFFSRRFDQAIAALRSSLHEFESFATTYRYLASSYAYLGRLDEAREVLTRLRAFTPAAIPPNIGWLRKAEHRELLLSGLRLAIGESEPL